MQVLWKSCLSLYWCLQGGNAVDAVEDAVRVLEDDTAFDAGHGSVLTEEMTVEVDAMIMDGSTLESGVYTLHVRSPELNLITKSFTSLFLLLLLLFLLLCYRSSAVPLYALLLLF